MHRIPRKILVLTFLMTAFLIASSGSVQAELKIGYIRPDYIFQNYEPYKEAQNKIQAYEKTEMDKLQNEGENFRKNLEQAQKQAVLMSEEIKNQKQEELAKQKEMLDKSYDELYREGGLMDKKTEEHIGPVIDKINEVLMRIGKNEGYDYILDAKAGGVLFANEEFEISDHVLEELKKEIPATQ